MAKRHLETALARLPKDAKYEVIWRPFFLQPDGFKDGAMDKIEAYKKKFGSEQRVKAIFARVGEAMKKVGITLTDQGKIGNTLDSHRLVEYAHTAGKSDAVIEAIMSAYFEKALDISSQAVLVKIANDAGVEGAEEFLKSSKLKDETKKLATKLRRQYNITGVPYMIFNDEYNFSGAQPPDHILGIFKKLGIQPEEEEKKQDRLVI